MSTAKRSSQWTNSYESQLSGEQLRWLHAALLARSPSDKEIIGKLPVWAHGPRKGQKPSPATLSNIRDRLEMEEDFKADEQTSASIVEALQQQDPALSPQKLDEIGQRTFTLLTIRRKDLKGWVSLQRAKKEREALALEKQKFMQATAEKILDETLRSRAAEIAGSNSSHAEKIEQLGRAMFGEDWK
jgi:hypothetical protein